jgi:3-deoxy-D-manno-octulosonic-acid transferase
MLENIKLIAGSRKIITIGSTHEGEEDLLLSQLRKVNNLFIILAPRHPSRMEEVIKVVKKYNIN